jgi:hypothetical protein
MTASQFWIYMLTIVLAPLVAVQVSEFINRRREGRSRRLWIFRTLMATRASRLAPDHVQALNMIDIEFYGDRRFRAILTAWKAYLNHLNTKTPPDVWLSRGNDLFFELLFEMARGLGFTIDKTDLRSTSYLPTAHGRVEDELARIRTGLLEVLDGQRAIPIRAPNSDHAQPGT